MRRPLRILFVILLICVCICIGSLLYIGSTYRVTERFDTLPMDADLQDPGALLKRMRGLLDKYDRPEVIGHLSRVVSMDPGELARMQLKLPVQN